MAQQVEHVLGKDEVTGSNPVSSSNIRLQILESFFAKICAKQLFRYFPPTHATMFYEYCNTYKAHYRLLSYCHHLRQQLSL